MKDYKLLDKEAPGICRTRDMACIPADERNRDWRAYLKWLAVPNTPDPADNP